MTASYAHIDFETASDLDVTDVGVYRYAEDPSTRILCMSWAIGDGPITTWLPGQPLPADLVAHVEAGGALAAWNDSFERVIWGVIGVVRHGFPLVDEHQWRNPQVLAMQSNLPASLDGAAAAVGSEIRKDVEGKKLMLKMSKGAPGDIARLSAYCEQDVATEREVAKRFGAMSRFERAVYTVSERINQRGILIDLDFVKLAAQAVREYQFHVAHEMARRYNLAPGQIERIRDFCAARGVVMGDLQADTVDNVLDLAEVLDPDVVTILRMRQQSAAVSPKKFMAMLRCVCSDGRLRGLYSYYGAMQTGRWSGRLVQPQNFPRPTMKSDDARAYMEALRRERTWQCLGSDPLEVLNNCIRPSLISPRDGFTVGDESSIEARVLAWIAGEEQVLDVFRNDGDIYIVAASDIYDRTITKDDSDERQIGKVATLALGFQGGKGAFMKMARGYGVKVTEARADEIKVAWRAKRPRTVTLWAVLEALALKALGYTDPIRGNVADLGYVEEVSKRLAYLGIRFEMKGRNLQCRLPSGRWLCYPHATEKYEKVSRLYWRMIEEGYGDAYAEEHSWRHRPRFYAPKGDKMVLEHTYGGKLTENIVQAIARDVLAGAIVETRDEQVVLHSHDEIAVEGDRVEALKTALERPPAWQLPDPLLLAELPLAASVKRLDRYWKA